MLLEQSPVLPATMSGSRSVLPSDLGLTSGFESPDLDRPGRLPHQQGLCEARLGCQDESPQLGGPGPGLECAGRHQGIHVMQCGHANKLVGVGEGLPGVRCRVEGRGDRERKGVCLLGA
jgi:hypothetical protein